jgi:hypothetical protein
MTCEAHSGIVEGFLNEHYTWNSIQGTALFREKQTLKGAWSTVIIFVTLGRWEKTVLHSHSGNIQGTFREHSGNI